MASDPVQRRPVNCGEIQAVRDYRLTLAAMNRTLPSAFAATTSGPASALSVDP